MKSRKIVPIGYKMSAKNGSYEIQPLRRLKKSKKGKNGKRYFFCRIFWLEMA